MGSLEEIASAAGVTIVHVGGLLLIRPPDALRLVDALAEARVRILGIEGFDVRGSEVRPDMELIADFSNTVDPVESATEARRFIESATRPAVLLEFSLPDEPGASTS